MTSPTTTRRTPGVGRFSGPEPNPPVRPGPEADAKADARRDRFRDIVPPRSSGFVLVASGGAPLGTQVADEIARLTA